VIGKLLRAQYDEQSFNHTSAQDDVNTNGPTTLDF
jgi:hypothetical protein